MATNASFATTPRYELAQASVANTGFDGTGTIVTLFTAGANGSRVDQIGWAAAGTTTAGLLKYFFRKSSGDTWRYIFAAPVSAITVSDTVGPWGGGATNLNIVLEAGNQIGFAPSKNEVFNSHITLAGDF